jgi:hypothetical protein
MAGERLIRPETAGGHDGARLTRGWRLGKGLTAGPHLSATARKKKKGEGVLGRRGCEAGPAWADGARAGKKQADGLGCLRAEKDVGPAGKEKERGREREEKRIFLISFQIHFSNIQTSIKQKSMHSNHDAQTLIISKLF